MDWGKATRWLIIFLTFLIIAGLAFSMNINNDIWLHLKTGEHIIDSKEIPDTDLFSHTAAGHEWVLHEWLAQVIFAGVYSFGFIALMILKVLLITGTFVILFFLIKDNVYVTSAVLLVGAFLMRNHFILRPHLFFWLFLAATLLIVKKRKGYWMLPIIILLWANMHSSVIIGLGVIVLYVGEHYYKTRDKRVLYPAVASFIAALLNPYTYKIFIFPFLVIGSAVNVQEWIPFSPYRPMFWAFTVFIVITLLLILRYKKIDIADVILFLGFTYLGYTARRNVAVAVIVILPMLAVRLNKWARFEITKPAVNRNIFFSLVLAVLLISSVISLNAFNPSFPERKYPLKALQFLDDNNIEGNIYNDYAFGGFTLFASDRKVFIDGRVDMYGAKIFGDYYAIKQAVDGWKDLVEKYDISIFMLKHDARVDLRLTITPGWKLVFFNELSSVHIKDNEENKKIKAFRLIGPASFDIPKDPGRVQRLIDEFKYLEQLDPDYPDTYRNLGVLYALGTQDKASAIAYLDKYLALDPKAQEIIHLRQQLTG